MILHSMIRYRTLCYAILRPISLLTLDFRGVDSSIILNLKGWNSHVHGGFTGKFESSNVSRDNLSREIGRTGEADLKAKAPEPSEKVAA